MSDESWRPVPGWDGYYEVSDHGRIRSLRTGVTLQTDRDRGGYHGVTLSVDRRRKRCLIHRAVLAAFVGPRPDGLVVRHLDGDRDNNSLANLAYGTQSENAHDRVRHGNDGHANMTHCVNGHAFTEANTYVCKDGWRHCRRCHADSERRARERAA